MSVLSVHLASLQHREEVHNHCYTISMLGLKEQGPNVGNITQISKLEILLINHLNFIIHCYVGHTHNDPILIEILE